MLVSRLSAGTGRDIICSVQKLFTCGVSAHGIAEILCELPLTCINGVQ